jgi:hypothetical protein
MCSVRVSGWFAWVLLQAPVELFQGQFVDAAS